MPGKSVQLGGARASYNCHETHQPATVLLNTRYSDLYRRAGCRKSPSLRSRAPEQQSLRWLTPAAGADPTAIAKRLAARGVKIVELSPEGRLLVAMASEDATAMGQANDIESEEILAVAMQAFDAAAADPKERGLGARPPTPEVAAEISRLFLEESEIEATPLALARATIAGSSGLPSSVDNSLSQYFPPIRSQGGQGSCTAWAAGYYYSTYTQARDENLVVSDGNNAHIHSPAFLYPLVNWGNDGGAYTFEVVTRLTEVGCSSWASKPYDQNDYTTWPGEAAWIEALNNRGLWKSSGLRIGVGIKKVIQIAIQTLPPVVTTLAVVLFIQNFFSARRQGRCVLWV
jgi:hypothetical protein